MRRCLTEVNMCLLKDDNIEEKQIHTSAPQQIQQKNSAHPQQQIQANQDSA